jgi:hypothetical protein
MDVALPLVTTSTDSSPTPPETEKATWFIEHIQHILQQVQYIIHNSNAKYKQRHDQHWVPHNFSGGRQSLVAVAERMPYRAQL